VCFEIIRLCSDLGLRVHRDVQADGNDGVAELQIEHISARDSGHGRVEYSGLIERSVPLSLGLLADLCTGSSVAAHLVCSVFLGHDDNP
jgi:hypothetical protein